MRPNSALLSFTSAALALPGIAIAPVQASEAVNALTAAYEFAYYHENDDRMRVEAHQAYLAMPINDQAKFSLDLVRDIVSGASPIFNLPPAQAGGPAVQVLSGASIHEERTAANLHGSYALEDLDLSATLGVSDEHDYRSRSASLESRWSFNQKNTTLSVGAGLSDDDIDPTKQNFHDTKRTTSALLGLTQTLSPTDLLQFNLTYGHNNGYLSDPYKQVFIQGAGIQRDSRPRSRDQWTLMGRYAHFLSDWDAALQFDYRYYRDDWGVRGHTLEARLHKPLGDGFELVPLLRYHSQSGADFYQPYFTSTPADGYYSSDYRLADFGAFSVGLRLNKDLKLLGKNAQFNTRLEYYDSNANYKLGSSRADIPAPLSFYLISLGLSVAF